MATARIHGPYEHRTKWRIVGVRPDGTRIRETFIEREDAIRWRDQARAALGQRTVAVAVGDYLAHMTATGRRESTLTTARYRLVAFLRCGTEDRLLSTLTPPAARTLYERRVADGVKADTHRGELALASTAAAWWLKQGWLGENPFSGVEPTGTRSAGGDHLRVDEARRFLSACLVDTSLGALASALALLTGARASEVTDRVVRDLDDQGRRLWVTEAKTKAGVRQLGVPEVLRGRLLAAAAGKAPTDRLFGDVTRHWLGHHVRRLCEVAKVPVISPHDLRRSYAMIRVRSTAADQVADELGQTGPAVTRRHYLEHGAEDLAHGGEVAEIIATPGVPGSCTETD